MLYLNVLCTMTAVSQETKNIMFDWWQGYGRLNLERWDRFDRVLSENESQDEGYDFFVTMKRRGNGGN